MKPIKKNIWLKLRVDGGKNHCIYYEDQINMILESLLTTDSVGHELYRTIENDMNLPVENIIGQSINAGDQIWGKLFDSHEEFKINLDY